MTKPLPPGWVRSTIGAVCLSVAKHQPQRQPNEEIIYIDIGGVDPRTHSISETKKYLGEEAPSRARQLVNVGDTLFSTVRVYLEKIAIVPDYLNGSTASTGFCVLRPSDALDPRYLYYRVLERSFIDERSTKQTGTSYPAVRDQDVLAMSISFPSLPEQERIVTAIEEHFSRIDAAESAAQTALARLDTLRRSILTAAFSGHLVKPLNPRRTPDDLPEDWHWSTLGDISQKPQYGWTTKSTYGTGINYLRTTDISRGKIDWNSVPVCIDSPDDLNRFILHHGDIVVSRAGSVGISCMIKNPPTAVFASYLIRLRVTDTICASYVAHFLKSSIYWTAISDAKIGIAVQNVNAKKLAAIRIPLAPPKEQERIVAAIEEHFSRIDAAKASLERCLQRCNILRRAVLAAAFSGRLVEQDSSDEPASVLLERIAAEQPKRRPRRKSV